MRASNRSCGSISLFAAGVASAGVLALACGHAAAVVVGPGSFEYRYNSQNATGTGASDPNAVLSSNVTFSGDGGAPNTPPNFVNFYRLSETDSAGVVGTLTYTFAAAAGQEFDGDASVSDRINVFNFLGNVRGEFSTDDGATFTDYTLRGSGDPERATNFIDVDGADSVILRYNIFSLAPAGQVDQVQLFRQANVFAQNLEPTPFVFSGTTVAAAVVPEPAGLAALGAGGLMLIRRRRAR